MSQCDLFKVSEDIYSIQKSKFNDTLNLKALSLYRKQSEWFTKLNYSCKKDTIFILEFPGIQGNYNFTFWNNTDTISYTNESGTFELMNKTLFTKYMMKLVSEWNIKEIKKEESINSNLLPSEKIYATKIIFLNKKYNMDSICFKDFFDFERDEMNINE